MPTISQMVRGNSAYCTYSWTTARTRCRPSFQGELTGFRCIYPVSKKTYKSRWIHKGGAWYYCNQFDGSFNTHHREKDCPNNWHNSLGFRCVYPRTESGAPKNA